MLSTAADSKYYESKNTRKSLAFFIADVIWNGKTITSWLPSFHQHKMAKQGTFTELFFQEFTKVDKSPEKVAFLQTNAGDCWHFCSSIVKQEASRLSPRLAWSTLWLGRISWHFPSPFPQATAADKLFLKNYFILSNDVAYTTQIVWRS